MHLGETPQKGKSHQRQPKASFFISPCDFVTSREFVAKQKNRNRSPPCCEMTEKFRIFLFSKRSHAGEGIEAGETVNSARPLHPPFSSLTPRKQTSPKKTHQPRTFTPLPPRRNLRVTRSEATKFHRTFAKFNTISTLRDFSQFSAPINPRSTPNLSPCDFKQSYASQGARPCNKKKGA